MKFVDDVSEILLEFEIQIYENPQSLVSWAPVYHIRHGNHDVVLKKTRFPLESAKNLINFSSFLKSKLIPVVTPVDLEMDGKKIENPKEIGKNVWVIYPFKDGSQYNGSFPQIYSAGKLLGKIHSSTTNNQFKLKEYPGYDFDEDDLKTDFKNIRELAKQSQTSFDPSKIESICFGAFQKARTLNTLLQNKEKFPWVSCSWDYKGSNLIFQNDIPTLIDIDNGGYVPRIVDLALALLLFNNDIESAPPRIFSVSDWELFLRGYYKFVNLTPREIEMWKEVLLHVYTDEVIWLIANHAEMWKQEHFRALFTSLLEIDFDLYVL